MKRIEVSRAIVAVLLFSFLALPQSARSGGAQKNSYRVQGARRTLVPYVISQRLGFLSRRGFGRRVIVTRGTVTTQVVVSGAVDYGNGGSIPAILGGARMKIIQVSTDKPSQYLVVSPKITNIKQLNGKTVAISDASGNSTLLFRELLSQKRRGRRNGADARAGRAVGSLWRASGRHGGRDHDHIGNARYRAGEGISHSWPTAATSFVAQRQSRNQRRQNQERAGRSLPESSERR